MEYIVTNKGLELQAKVNAGKKLIFTRGEAGSGIAESPELMNELVNKKQNLQIDSVESLGTKTELSCVLTNLEVQEEYLLTQLAIYARCEGETEVLFIVGQQAQGEPIPAISKQEVEYIFPIAIKMDNTKDISIDVGVNDFLRKPYFYDHVNQHDNPHAVTKSHVGLGNVDNTRDLEKPVSTPIRDAISSSYASSNGYADQKIAALVNGSPEALDTLLELATAINNNKALADALQDAIGKKANQTEVDTHTGNKTVHITASERSTWNAKQNTITVDAALSLTSTNSIQNKAVKTALDKQTAITTEINSNLGGIISVGTATVTSNNNGYITNMPFVAQSNCDLLVITTLTEGVHIDAWYSNGWIGFARRISDNVVMANSTFSIKYMRIKGK